MPSNPPTTLPPPTAFFGPWVVRATFTLALLGWGMGFYGPPIYLHAVLQRTGWPLALVSMAVTVHYLFGAAVVTRLPALHRRFGVGPTAVAGAAATGLGVLGWALAAAPWQLFAAALLSGGGWVTMGAVAVNAAIAPWYERARPMALAKAYNGASIGGVVFSPLWVLLIGAWGFATAAAVLGLGVLATVALLSKAVFSQTPARRGQRPDGHLPLPPAPGPPAPAVAALPGRQLWQSRRFQTLAAGMAAGLFAQVGLLAHLFTLLVAMLGATAAGWAMALTTGCALAGRMAVARLLPPGSGRRTAAAWGYAVQMAGGLLLWWAMGRSAAGVWLGLALFGSGIGNATSLPPLIAQAEFAREDVPRVVALVVAIAQCSYALAPALLGLLLAGLWWPGAGSSAFFAAAVAVQGLALLCFAAGRRQARGR